MNFLSDQIFTIILMAVLLIFSGFFSAVEMSFSSLNRTRIKAMAEAGNKRAVETLKLIENYDKLLSTTLVGNNAVNIVLASISTLFFIRLIEDQDLATTLSSVVITVAILIFGEITPKSLAKDAPESYALATTPLIRILIWLFTPVNLLFTGWKKLISQLLGTGKSDNKITENELLLMLQEVQDSGSIDKDTGELLRSAVEFNNTTAFSIATHRTAIKGIEVHSTLQETAKMFEDTGYSRAVVYDQNMDNIVGVIHHKDLFKNGVLKDKPISEIMSAPVFAPYTEKIDNLLKLLQNKRSHLAIIVDELGGTMGLITLEDILEELVGEIWDDNDEIRENITRISDKVWVIAGALPIREFCQSFDLKIDSNCITMAGWMMEYLEEIPHQGQSFEHQGFTFTVEKRAGNSIRNIRVTKKE